MTDREALQELLFVAPISEDDKARILAIIPEMTEEEVRVLGEILAKEERAFDARLSSAIDQADVFLKEYAN
ncbi:MAG: hypothetical protein AAB448_01130 [Patescibacteria group bacterium]